MGIVLNPGAGIASGRKASGGKLDAAILDEAAALIDADNGTQVAPLLTFEKYGSAGSAGYAYKSAVEKLAESRGTPCRIVSLARTVADLQALFVPPADLTRKADREKWIRDNVPESLRNANPEHFTFVLERREVTS